MTLLILSSSHFGADVRVLQCAIAGVLRRRVDVILPELCREAHEPRIERAHYILQHRVNVNHTSLAREMHHESCQAVGFTCLSSLLDIHPR